MKTITIQLYEFSELSEAAKETAINSYNEHFRFVADHFYDEALNTIKKFCDLTDVKTSLDSWLSPKTNHIDDKILELSGLRLRTWLINNWGWWLYKRKYIGYGKGEHVAKPDVQHQMIRWRQARGKTAMEEWYRMYYSNIQKDTSFVLTGVCYDDDFLAPLYDFIDNYDAAKHGRTDFGDLIDECFSALEKSLRDEEEYHQSDEAVIERIEADEILFFQNGRISSI